VIYKQLKVKTESVTGRRCFTALLLVGLFLLKSGPDAEAQILKPFTPLRVIQTEHFEIIFPKDSEPTARTLAGFADGIYEQISGILGITLKKRIPITITPHTDEFNGYMNPLPYPHIVLYDTPSNPESMGFADSLESLFLHELTHAVSLSTRSRPFEILHSIFGGWVYPTGLTAPMFMVEGVAVSFESLDGTGRANDPLIKERLLQAIHEDAFLNPFQASGVYDLPPTGNAYYDYGGLFSAYLQKKYGMELYARLWQAMGSEYHLSLFFYNNGFFHSFKKIYGISLPDAWEEFKEELRIWTIEENSGGAVWRGLGIDTALISGTASGGGKVFVLDRISGKVLAYDPPAEKTTIAARVDRTAYGLAASAGGERVLVSSYRYFDGLARTVVTEYETRWGGKTGRTWNGLYHGRYFRDGVIGINSILHSNNIVFRGPSGNEELLLRGNSRMLYSNPTALDDTWIVFTVMKEGKRELCLYNYETREIYTLVSELEDDAERWRYLRGLGVSQGRIFFSFDHNGRMYKLGMADLGILEDGSLSEKAELYFSERDISGGVFQPVQAGDEIYYRGAFTTWDVLMRYPERAEDLSGIRSAAGLRAWTGEERDAALFGIKPVFPVTGAESKPYFSLKYFNPLLLWIPYPLARLTGEGVSFDGVSFFSYFSDPADNNRIFLTASADIKALMAPINLQWTNLSLGFPVQLNVLDDIRYSQGFRYRSSNFSLNTSFSRGLGGEALRFFITPDFSVGAYAWDPSDGSSAYTWPSGETVYGAGLKLDLSSLTRLNWELFGRGFYVSVYGNYLFREPSVIRLEGSLQGAFEPYLPLRLSFYGVWDENGMDIHGKSILTNSSIFDAWANTEYTGTKLSTLRWLGGGEAELKLFSLEAQNNFSHLYFNRIFGTVAYRGGFYHDQDLRFVEAEGTPLGGGYRLTQSLILRLGFTGSTIAVTALPIKASLYFWGAWKISNMNDGKNNDFVFSPGFRLEM
jgi:hypothetical protein